MTETYEFIDCGNGRRLESFSGILVNRPSPAALGIIPALSHEWEQPDLFFDEKSGWQGVFPEDWKVRFGGVQMSLQPSSGGQLGVFPEHSLICTSIEEEINASFSLEADCRILNLFAHTGLVSLRLALLPCVREIVHIDAMPGALRRARKNAALSGLGNVSIRWIAEDALDFISRESRRGRYYDVIIADPPAFGRAKKAGGRKKREWRLKRDLPELIFGIAKILGPRGIVWITGHSDGFDKTEVTRLIRGTVPDVRSVRSTDICLVSQHTLQKLDCGSMIMACL